MAAPTTFTVPVSLTHLSLTVHDYLTTHPHLDNLVSGCLVFHNHHLLIVQRAKEERSYANLWEVPGGSCDDADETILHGAARELLEEAGLTVRRFIAAVGEGVGFETGEGVRRRKWWKWSFIVEVVESEEVMG